MAASMLTNSLAFSSASKCDEVFLLGGFSVGHSACESGATKVGATAEMEDVLASTRSPGGGGAGRASKAGQDGAFHSGTHSGTSTPIDPSGRRSGHCDKDMFQRDMREGGPAGMHTLPSNLASANAHSMVREGVQQKRQRGVTTSAKWPHFLHWTYNP